MWWKWLLPFRRRQSFSDVISIPLNFAKFSLNLTLFKNLLYFSMRNFLFFQQVIFGKWQASILHPAPSPDSSHQKRNKKGLGVKTYCKWGKQYYGSLIRIRILNRILLVPLVAFKFFSKLFFLIIYLRNVHINIQRQKVLKKSQNCKNQGFWIYFSLLIGGSRSGSVQINTGLDPDPAC